MSFELSPRIGILFAKMMGPPKPSEIPVLDRAIEILQDFGQLLPR